MSRKVSLCTAVHFGSFQAQRITFAWAAFLGLSLTSANAQSTLAVGDIGIIGFNSNAPDGISFVIYRAIEAGTVIKFTDNGFLSSGSATAASNARGGENFVTWTAPAGGLAAGSVVRLVNTSGSTTTVTGGGSAVQALNGISNSGDQIFIYQGAGAGTLTSNSDFGSNGNPTTFTGTILFGLNFQSNWLSTGTANSNKSYLPSQLNAANANIAHTASTVTSGQYTGTRSGLTAALFSHAVANATNWTTNTSGNETLSVTNFTPEATATIHWDANGTAAGTGGAGTWDVATANRFKNGTAGTTFTRWVNSSAGNDHTAVFGGTAGTVSIGSGGVTASGLQFDVSGYTLQNNTITLSGAATPALNVGTAGHIATVASTLAGASGVSKTGAGTLVLSGANTFTGATAISGGTLEAAATDALGGTIGVTVNSGGTLLLSGAGTDRIDDAATITMAGGTIAFSGNVTEGSSPGTGALTLSSSSVIDFANGDSVINFGASSLATWALGATLSIWNWGGSTAGGGNDQLLFGADSSSLSSGQLSQIQFYSGAGTGFLGTGMFVGSLGEVVPVPEPASTITAALLLGLANWREHSRRRARDQAGRRAAVFV